MAPLALYLPFLLDRFHPFPAGAATDPWRFSRVIEQHELGTTLGISLAFLALALRWA